MQIVINVEKRHLIFLVVLVCLLFVVGVSASNYASSSGVGHDASEIGPGTFGGGINAIYGFPGSLNISGNLTMTNIDPLSNGIFWGITPTFSRPHINYDTTTGLWISTGTTGTNVTVETTNYLVADKIIAKNNITAGNITATGTITLGSVARSSWPAETTTLPASNISNGTFGSKVGSYGSYSFPSNLTVTNNLIAGNITATGTITLGGVSRNSWPSIYTGTISNQEQLSVPSGYNKDQCFLIISMEDSHFGTKYDTSFGDTPHDWFDNHYAGAQAYYIDTANSWTIICRYAIAIHDADHCGLGGCGSDCVCQPDWKNAQCRYLLICVK